jgi:ankyrin repeat protein
MVRSSESALFIGSNHGHMDIVKCLLSSSADINMCNNLRQSPLFVASLKGHCDVVKCLVSDTLWIYVSKNQFHHI